MIYGSWRILGPFCCLLECEHHSWGVAGLVVSSSMFYSAAASCWTLSSPGIRGSESGSGPGDHWYSYNCLVEFPLRNGLFSGVLGWGLSGCRYFGPSCVPSLSQSSCSPGNLHLAHPQAFAGSRLLRPQRGPVGFSTFSGIGSYGWDLMGVLFCCVLSAVRCKHRGPQSLQNRSPGAFGVCMGLLLAA